MFSERLWLLYIRCIANYQLVGRLSGMGGGLLGLLPRCEHLVELSPSSLELSASRSGSLHEVERRL